MVGRKLQEYTTTQKSSQQVMKERIEARQEQGDYTDEKRSAVLISFKAGDWVRVKRPRRGITKTAIKRSYSGEEEIAIYSCVLQDGSC